MGFFERLSNGWSLAMESMKIVWRNKKLMLFPLVSTICLLLVLATFAGGLFASGAVRLEGGEFDDGGRQMSDVTYYGLLFIFYYVCYFVIVFFNMALIHCANYAFNGSEFTLGAGVAFSASKIHTIASWAFVSATVGIILKIIEDKSEKVAAIIAGILGMLWSVLTFFVVPVIAYEGLGPIAAIRRSGELFKQTWGERVGAHFAFGWIGFLSFVFIALPVGLLLWMLHPVAGVVAGGLCALAIWAMTTAAETVFKAAAYQYAIGRPVDALSVDRIRTSFGPK